MKCCICGKFIELQRNELGQIIWTKGHNAEPVKSGRCCGVCNYEVVLPVRPKQNLNDRKESENDASTH